MIIKDVFENFRASFKSPGLLADDDPVDILKRCFKALVALLVFASVIEGIIIIIDTGDFSKNAGLDSTLIATLISLNIAFSVLLFFLGTCLGKVIKKEAPSFLNVAAPFAIFTVVWTSISLIISIPLRFFMEPSAFYIIIIETLSLLYVIYYLHRVQNIKLWVGLLGLASTLLLAPLTIFCLYLYPPAWHKIVKMAAPTYGEENFTEFFTDEAKLLSQLNGLTLMFEYMYETEFGHPASYRQLVYFENEDVYRLDMRTGMTPVFYFGRYQFFNDQDDDILMCFKYYKETMNIPTFQQNGSKPLKVPRAFLEEEFTRDEANCSYPISLAGEFKFIAPEENPEILNIKFVQKWVSDVNGQKAMFAKETN